MSFLKKYFPEIVLAILVLTFSFWLMWHTFSYEDGSMLIAEKVWSDFGSHIPLIRSFSLGDNFPPEYPLFPGETIRYHYLFYLLVGLLEKTGLRIDFALNIPSAISFTLLALTIYFLGKIVFKSKVVGMTSVLLFLFNSSFSFIKFFEKHPLSTNTLNEIVNNEYFVAFGPYDGQVISAFWTLNIYTNQRHLATGIALILIFLFIILKHEKSRRSLKNKQAILLGIILGLTPYLHSGAFIILILILSSLAILLPKQRKPLLLLLIISFTISLHRISSLTTNSTYSPKVRPGYLIPSVPNFLSFLEYWTMNLGLSFFTIPIGTILAPRLGQKLFLSIVPLFIVGNLIQFSPEIAANHKFFTVFLVIGNIFTAYLLVTIWKRKTILTKPIALFLVILLTFGGIIDFFPIKNDRKFKVLDIPKNKAAQWITKNTPKDAVFLNSTYLYDSASIAGRKIFLGWPYFSWSIGYNTNQRFETQQTLLTSNNKHKLCDNLNAIDYIEVSKYPHELLEINTFFFEKEFTKSYEDENLTIYNVRETCSLN